MPRIPERIKVRVVDLAGQIDAQITQQPPSHKEGKALIERLLPLEQEITETLGWNFGDNPKANLEAGLYVVSETFTDDQANVLTLFKVLHKSARRKKIEGAHILPSNFSLPVFIVRPEMVDVTDEGRHKIELATDENSSTLPSEGIDFLVIVDTVGGFVAQEYYCFNNTGQAIRVVDLQKLSSEDIAEDYLDEAVHVVRIQLQENEVITLPERMLFPMKDGDFTYIESILQEIGTRWKRIEPSA